MIIVRQKDKYLQITVHKKFCSTSRKDLLDQINKLSEIQFPLITKCDKLLIFWTLEDLRLGLYDTNPPTRICCPLPFYHTFSNTGIVISSAVSLTTLVCPAEFFNAEDTLRAVKTEKCNVLDATPTMFIDMLHHPRLAEFDLSTLRVGVAGGAPMPHAVALQVAEKLHIPQILVNSLFIFFV